jgi:hypothetical protein
MTKLPEADRLRFFAGANGGQEFLFEQQHAKCASGSIGGSDDVR